MSSSSSTAELTYSCRTQEQYTINFHDDVIYTTLTHTASVVDEWLSEIRTTTQKTIVGLDTEWRPSFKRHVTHLVSILQLCIGRRCLIFQLMHADAIPQSLCDFLADPAFTFVGVSIDGDAEKLLNDFELEVGHMEDLRTLAAKKLDNEGLRQAGLKSLARLVLGVEMEKNKKITMSRWDYRVLSPNQVKYACVDAFVSFEIANHLMN